MTSYHKKYYHVYKLTMDRMNSSSLIRKPGLMIIEIIPAGSLISDLSIISLDLNL